MIEVMEFEREGMWEYLPKDMTIAELGVWTGAFSEYILMYARPSTLYLVDSWIPEHSPMRDEATPQPKPVSHYYNLIERYRNDTRVILWRGDTVEFLETIPSVDAIYIDSDHGYIKTCEELEAALPKVKRYITGHDYVEQFGVVQAVNEFVERNNFKLQITGENLYKTSSYPSFIICVDS